MSNKSPKIGDKIDLIFNVKIDEGWHLYSNDSDTNCYPIPASFKFNKNSSFKLIGDIKPIGAEKHHDDLMECDYKAFEHKALFKQTIKIVKSDVKVAGVYDYQVCTDAGKCIVFDDEFEFNIKSKVKEKTEAVEEETDSVEEEMIVEVDTVSTEIRNAEKVETNFITEEGDFAKGKDGKDYVKVNNNWVVVPEGNSSKFYQKYLMLGGHE